MYNIFNQNLEVPTGKQKWNEIYDMSDESWKRIYNEPFITTKSTSLRWLQVRINHNILATNTFLTRIQVIDNPLCTFCNSEPETIKHLLWQCHKTQKILNDLKIWLTSKNLNIEITEKSFLFGLFENKTNEIEKNILMETKAYIYRFQNNKTEPIFPITKNKTIGVIQYPSANSP